MVFFKCLFWCQYGKKSLFLLFLNSLFQKKISKLKKDGEVEIMKKWFNKDTNKKENNLEK